MAPPLLTYRGLRQSLGDLQLFDDIELQIAARDRICLIGRNGSGKSTLLRVLAGMADPDGGDRFVQPGVTVGYMAQEVRLTGQETAGAFAAAGLPEDGGYRARMLLDQLQIPEDLPLDNLSGGEQRRIALAQSLAAAPDILLLDEPTNHLDLPAIEWLEAELQRLDCAVVLVSHDRAFLRRTTARTWWLDRGRLRVNRAGFADYEAWAERVEAAEAKERRQLDKVIKAESRWAAEGISARRRRNQGRVARLAELRERRAAIVGQIGRADLRLDSGATSGKMVLEAEGLQKSYEGRPVVRDFSLRVQRGDRIGVIGPNGAGKTTLIRLLMKETSPDRGRVRHGSNLTPRYIDQSRNELPPEKTVQDILCPRGGDQVDVHGQPRHIAGFLKDFLFSPGQARAPVSSLSGGEQNRLLLARALCQECNLLVLDEPTNDLDMDTLDLLVDLLGDFDGTLLVVSHDRDFLNRVVNATLVFEGEGRITEYAGGYDDYLRQRGEVMSVTPRGAEKAKQKPKPKLAQSNKPKRLSYKFERELALLPDRIADLETEIQTAEAALADPALYNRSPADYDKAVTSLAAAKAALDDAEARWLELEMMREEAEA